MSLVVTDPDLAGLGAMLADLVRGNIEADPSRAKLLQGVSGKVNVHARDAEVAVGMEFKNGQLHVFAEPFRDATLTIETDSDTLMGMSTVPLRFGMPDVAQSEGRTVVKKMLRGDLKVRGMVRGMPLMVRLQKLLSVA
ncbi:MAG TPA: hypothetical protein VJ922_03345 [Actinomycetota bacterium]|nr:hypothetical protein [Actinomycetota bacterium]